VSRALIEKWSISAGLAVAGVALTLTVTAVAEAVTVKATEVRDEIELISGPEVTRITGAATVSGTGCVAVNAVRANRPAGVECPRTSTWDINLGAGDDVLAVSTSIPGSAFAGSVGITAGTGNDVITAYSDNNVSVTGGDGDDTLATVMPLDPLEANSGVPFIDMGAGRDLVDYAGAPFGLTVELLDNENPSSGLGVARIAKGPDTRDPDTGQPRNTFGRSAQVFRNVERVAGSPASDLLVGTGGADDLFGAGGVDTIRGLDGPDLVDGGPGSDTVDPGEGADVIVGGPGIDDFPVPKDGGDRYDTRDGLAENVLCQKGDTVMNDLVDILKAGDGCAGIQTAAAKHRFDTVLPRGPLSVDAAGALVVRVACPSLKTETCAGTLRVRRGGDRGTKLASAPYRVARGRSARIRFTLTADEAKGLRGRVATLEASEVDADKRARRVVTRPAIRR
jgi:hypothetical protein